MTEPEEKPVEIPYADLDEETLNAVIESFVLREGTDYGVREAQLTTKVQEVLRQLRRREIKLVYDPQADTCTFVPARDFKPS